MAADQSPPPPASGGPELTRRSLLKTGAGAAAGAAVLSGSDVGHVDLQSPIGDADALAVSSAIAAGALAGAASGYLFGTTLQDYDDALDAEISRSEAIAHDASVSEMESYGDIELLIDNDLETTSTMAHQAARNAVATAWESGKSSGDAYNDALDAIEQYYAERVENNWIMATAKSITQHAYARTAAIEALVDGGTERDIDNDTGAWSLGAVEHPDYGTVTWSELLEERQEREMELQDGSTISVYWPDVLLEWDGDGVSETVNLLDFLRDYDDSEGDFGVTIDDERVPWDGSLEIPSISYEDEDDETTTLQGYTALDFVEQYREILDQIEGQSATVVDNYDQGLVEDIYVKLDEGEITPSDVRGIDGTAAYLSGTEDATSDSYRMALLQQLEIEQADLSETASMSITYDGNIGNSVVRDDSGDRSMYLGQYVTDRSYDGLLWARKSPDGGLNTDGKYAVDPIVYAGSMDDTIRAINPLEGSELFSISAGVTIRSLEVSPDGQTFYAVHDEDGIFAYDATDGSELWTYDGHSDMVNNIAASPDGSTLYSASDDNDVHAIDVSDGSQIWGYSGLDDSVQTVAVSPDSSMVFAGDWSGELHAFTAEDGSEEWTYSGHSDAVISLDVSPLGSTLYSGSDDESVHAISVSDGSEDWSYTDHSDSVNAVAVSPDGSSIFSGAADNSVHSIDAEDGSQNWSYDGHDGNVLTLSVSPDGSRVYSGSRDSTVHAIDTSGPSEIWSFDGHSDRVYAVAASLNPSIRPDLEVGDVAYGATMYDAVDSEEIPLRNGIVTVDSLSDQDGEDIDKTAEWSEPEYDEIDMDRWVEYLVESEEYRETIEQYIDEETSGGGGTTDDDLLDGLPTLPSWIPGGPLVQYVIVGAAGIAGINLATN